MSDEKFVMHYVCTHEQAQQLVEEYKEFWLSNCGCREQRGACARSRLDVCLEFYEPEGSGGSGLRVIDGSEVQDIFKEAKEKHLVTRPFRDKKNPAKTKGICFCCDDCCGYFLNPVELCDKGSMIEVTDSDICTLCGECVDACFFKARRVSDDTMIVDRKKCYGCGLCVDECPVNCIEMTART